MILGLPSSFLRDARRAFNYKPIAERSGTTVGRPLTDEEIIQLVEHKPNRAKAEILARAHQRERDERERAQAGIIQFKDEINQDSAASLIAQLDDIITDKVVLRIASQGGFVGDAFKIVNARLSSAAASSSARSFQYPGTTPGISASGTANGIVWAIENSNPAVLHAYDALDLSHELYNSGQAAAGRDAFGAGNKFVTPTIVNGRVFVGTATGVAVFSRFGPSAPTGLTIRP
jgi:hypothetical protein